MSHHLFGLSIRDRLTKHLGQDSTRGKVGEGQGTSKEL